MTRRTDPIKEQAPTRMRDNETPAKQLKTALLRAMKPPLPADSVERAKEFFDDFSLSKFRKDATPSNYLPTPKKAATMHHAEKLQYVQDFQREKIEQHLGRLKAQMAPKHAQKNRGSVRRGVTLVLPAGSVQELLPSLDKDEKTVDLDEVMGLIAQHTRGTEFHAKGDPTLKRIAIRAHVEKLLGRKEGGKRK